MVSLRRQKLKAKRAGFNSTQVDKCNSVAEVVDLMRHRVTLQPGEEKKIEVQV